jgi:hypothetical protein
MSNAFVFAQSRLRPVVLAAGLVTASLLPAAAASSLPAPYVSRALDAVLIPINAVKKVFWFCRWRLMAWLTRPGLRPAM